MTHTPVSKPLISSLDHSETFPLAPARRARRSDLGNNKIIDIEDNAIQGNLAPNGQKAERVVFVLLENEHCSANSAAPAGRPAEPEDACAAAPKVNAPAFDSPCYNGGTCEPARANQERYVNQFAAYNYTCICPPGFAGPLCEINVDDCVDHQCQNGAMCVDEVNSYRCVCRDPTTKGRFCEELISFAASSANSIAPVALPMVAAAGAASSLDSGYPAPPPAPQVPLSPPAGRHQRPQQQPQQQILTRSADFQRPSVNLIEGEAGGACKRLTQRKYFDDGNGCQSVRLLKISDCAGQCGAQGCCQPAKVKRRRVRMQCTDGASYVKTIDLVKKCACSSECTRLQTNNYDLSTGYQQQVLANQYNTTQEEAMLQISRLDAFD